MTKYFRLLLALALSVPFAANAADPMPAAKVELTKVTFLVTGLHCPLCTKTVESAVLKLPGVKAAKVD